MLKSAIKVLSQLIADVWFSALEYGHFCPFMFVLVLVLLRQTIQCLQCARFISYRLGVIDQYIIIGANIFKKKTKT